MADNVTPLLPFGYFACTCGRRFTGDAHGGPAGAMLAASRHETAEHDPEHHTIVGGFASDGTRVTDGKKTSGFIESARRGDRKKTDQESDQDGVTDKRLLNTRARGLNIEVDGMLLEELRVAANWDGSYPPAMRGDLLNDLMREYLWEHRIRDVTRGTVLGDTPADSPEVQYLLFRRELDGHPEEWIVLKPRPGVIVREVVGGASPGAPSGGGPGYGGPGRVGPARPEPGDGPGGRGSGRGSIPSADTGDHAGGVTSLRDIIRRRQGPQRRRVGTRRGV